MPDLWAAFTSVSIQAITMDFTYLIPFVLVSKITPAHVEATVFAFSTMIINSIMSGGKITGTLWNKLFMVDTENMENLYKLLLL